MNSDSGILIVPDRSKAVALARTGPREVIPGRMSGHRFIACLSDIGGALFTSRCTLKQIYKITWPTGKIYIGKDRLGSARYVGSIARDVLNRDFKNLTDAVRNDYTIRKEILWQSEDCTDAELSAKEVEFIRKYNSNLPHIGYNRWPKPKKI